MRTTPFEDFSREYEKRPTREKLVLLKQWLSSIADPEIRLEAETQFLLGRELLDVVPRKRQVILLIHGIRTHGSWQPKIEAELQKFPNVIVIPLGYEFFGILSFLSPVFTRGTPRETILRDVRYCADEYKDDEVSVVAHSFGTYLISSIINNEVGICFKRILLCGSIVPSKTKWTMSHPIPRDRFLNDVGTKDFLPVLAKSFSWGYGSSGTFGFKKPNVTDRFHPLGHSDFFTDSHIQTYWVPFLVHGKFVASTYSSEISAPKLWLSWIDLVPLKYPLIALIVFSFYKVVKWVGWA